MNVCDYKRVSSLWGPKWGRFCIKTGQVPTQKSPRVLELRFQYVPADALENICDDYAVDVNLHDVRGRLLALADGCQRLLIIVAHSSNAL